MNIIPKEKAFIYCVKKKNIETFFAVNKEEVEIDKINYYFCFYTERNIEDVTVNKNNELHSYDDQPALVFLSEGAVCKRWFINGMAGRENQEKANISLKNTHYIIGSGLLGTMVNFNRVKENIYEIKNIK
jgi:hypothetical protein